MLYIMIIGLSAFLLFQVQPLIAKIILPVYGGGASIWLACLAFFQILLLVGYASCHFLIQKLGNKKYLYWQIFILSLSLICLPLQARYGVIENLSIHPTLSIFLLLLLSVGLPYFVLSTTSPVIQYWMVIDGRVKAQNPYLLYAVSNTGSLSGLLIYPLVVETTFTNTQQTSFWSLGYGLYALLVFICILSLFKNITEEKGNGSDHAEEGILRENNAPEEIHYSTKLKWIVQSMIPSAALLAVTHYMTLDIASFPFLWVIPLSLYLVSFVLCFALPVINRPHWMRTLLILLNILLLGPLVSIFLFLREFLDLFMIWHVTITSLFFFLLCLYFHGELEREKPHPRQLTSFYLYLSLGGCLGGVFVSVIAPLLFHSNFEFYLVMVASLYLILNKFFAQRRRFFRLSFQGSIILLLTGLYLIFETTLPSPITHISYTSRSFYNTYDIVDLPDNLKENKIVRLLLKNSMIGKDELPDKYTNVRLLVQGTTIHGGQTKNKKGLLVPMFYYHEGSGVGKAFLRFPQIKRVAIIGLGSGIAALYGKKGQIFDLYEIDPMVVDLAQNQFENLKACPAKKNRFIGDGRLKIQNKPLHYYDLILVDVFSSDAIPTHLLTLEGIEIYLRVLQKNGLILINISNNFVDLWPVLNGVAEKLHLFIRLLESKETAKECKMAADWIVLTRDEKTLNKLIKGNGNWQIKNNKKIYWTDEFSNLWSIIKFVSVYRVILLGRVFNFRN